jgi:hypothetical protein
MVTLSIIAHGVLSSDAVIGRSSPAGLPIARPSEHEHADVLVRRRTGSDMRD